MEEHIPTDNFTDNFTYDSKTKKQIRRERKKKQRDEAEAGNVIMSSYGILKDSQNYDNYDNCEIPLVLLSQDAKQKMEELFHYQDEAIEAFNQRMQLYSVNEKPDVVLAEIASMYPRSDESLKPEISRFLLSPYTHVGHEGKIIGGMIMYLTHLGNLSYRLKPQLKKCWKENKCTFSVTKDNFVKQIGYNCSCFEDNTMSICRLCVKHCHNDKSMHKVKQISNNKVMFCDCGAGVKSKYVNKCNCC